MRDTLGFARQFEGDLARHSYSPTTKIGGQVRLAHKFREHNLNPAHGFGYGRRLVAPTAGTGTFLKVTISSGAKPKRV